MGLVHLKTRLHSSSTMSTSFVTWRGDDLQAPEQFSGSFSNCWWTILLSRYDRLCARFQSCMSLVPRLQQGYRSSQHPPDPPDQPQRPDLLHPQTAAPRSKDPPSPPWSRPDSPRWPNGSSRTSTRTYSPTSEGRAPRGTAWRAFGSTRGGRAPLRPIRTRGLRRLAWGRKCLLDRHGAMWVCAGGSKGERRFSGLRRREKGRIVGRVDRQVQVVNFSMELQEG